MSRIKLVKESLYESKKFDEMSNDKLRELINEDPSSEDGIIAKTELKRRNDVNGVSESRR